MAPPSDALYCLISLVQSYLAGTGVAPMRSFLHHRIYVQGATENVLFFGCRKRDMDYHYREEWEQLEQEGRLKVFTACSRDQV